MIAFNWPAYNFMFHSSPFDDMVREYYHWHFDNSAVDQGRRVRMGLRFLINHTAPEDAAAYLRDVDMTDFGGRTFYRHGG